MIENKNGSFIECTLTSNDEDDLKLKINDYYAQYPFAGYMTKVIYGPAFIDGKWETLLTRFTSCD